MSILRLKEVLKEKGVTGKELAETIGVTENTISMIANEKRQPRFDLLLQIAETLNVDVRELFNPTKEADREFDLYFKTSSNEFVPFGKLKLHQ